MNAYAQSANTYLTQRVLGADPARQAALLMEAGQRYLGKAIKAMGLKDHFEVAKCLDRVAEIITESVLRLDHEEGGELARHLLKVYDWWTRELFEASRTRDRARLEALSQHMGEIRQAWEQLQEKQVRGPSDSEFQIGDQVV